MALHPDNTLISNRELLTEMVLVPFRAIGGLLTKLAENNSRTQALRAIADIPEEELQRRGTTRAELITQTFRHDG